MYQRLGETVRVGKMAYRLSQSLGRTKETITSLLFKANSLYLGQHDKAIKYVVEAESLLNSLSDVSPSYLTRQKKNILFRKSYAYFYKGEWDEALEAGLECLKLLENSGNKSDTAYILYLLGCIYLRKDDIDIALDYASSGLTMFEEIGDQVGLATILELLGAISYNKGELNQAIKYCKKILSSIMISSRVKLLSMSLLGEVYVIRGEFDKALKYSKQGIVLAEKDNLYDFFVRFQIKIGSIYMLKGEYDLALEYLKPGLSLAEKMKDVLGITSSLVYLVFLYLEKDDIEEVKKYLKRLKKMEVQMGVKVITHAYQLLKAIFLLKTGGSRNRTEAETLLKQISSDETNLIIITNALIYLCEFYLEELKLFEDTEALSKVNPLIGQLYKISEEQRLYGTLAETKLLQAKVALIQMNFEEAQRLLTQAQRVAELYGITRTAQKISSEHDNYLEKLSEWKSLKERDAPVSERLRLASVEGVIERLQGKGAIEPPELVDEEPIVLLIMDKSGVSYFTYPFKEDWDFEWLFSSFMSAFDTFSSEVFSESIDRIKIGENLILINPIETFLVCYVIKGQSYLGLQKLNRFSEAVRNNSDIWERLTKAVQTGEELELNNPTALGDVMNEIFSV